MLLLIAIVLVNLLLGLFVFARNPRSLVNRLFLLMTVAISLWSVTNYLTDNAGNAQREIMAKWAFVFPVLTTSCLAFLARLFPVNRGITRKSIYVILVPTITGVAISLTDLVVGGIRIRSDGTDVLPGGGYLVYILCVLALFIYSVVTYGRSLKNATKIQRLQAKYVAYGFAIGFLWALIFSAVLPGVNASFSSIAGIGPAGTVVFVALSAYAIVRHKLFDIRLVILRAISYAVLVLVIAVLYGMVTIPAVSWLVGTYNITITQQELLYVAVAVILALTFQPIRRYVSRATNALFFSDAYDTQVILDKVSSVIVGNIDPRKIQKESATILRSALKSEYATFVLMTGAGVLTSGLGVGSVPDLDDSHEVMNVLKKIGKHIIFFDEVESSDNKLHGVSVAAPLVTRDDLIGYLFFGSKQSGAIYNEQDRQLLAIATNELAVALQNAQRFEEIQAFNITLQEKVNEATRELKSTNKKLVELDEAKDEFISMASHQLRTPLTSIKGYLSMILDGDMGKLNKNQQNALKEAFGSSQRMVFLISDFLNVSRIKTGKFVIEPVEVNLTTMVAEELNQLKELAESREITFVYQQPGEFPIVKLDDNKIRQVMMNMVDNAIYYTPVGGTVTIQLMSDGKEISFKVIDTGIGVPKAEQHKLFTKFFRAGNARVARPDGTGLGLFMAQKIVVAQKGAIIFESEEGKGSTFGFRFPLKEIKP